MPGPTSPKVPGIVLIPCLRILLSSVLSTFPPNSPLQKLRSWSGDEEPTLEGGRGKGLRETKLEVSLALKEKKRGSERQWRMKTLYTVIGGTCLVVIFKNYLE